jgi:chaperone modulatory protein CbpM
MIGFEGVLREFALSQDELSRWIAEDWVRPSRHEEGYRFQEIDLARIRLIVDLREMLEVDEVALPTVLSLIDQVYGMRRAMRAMNEALAVLPAALRAQVASALDEPN